MQTSDLTLAWMMSKYEQLGLRFNERYLYDQFVNLKAYLKKYEQKGHEQWGEGEITYRHNG